jgi:hypothetical protein
LPIHQPPPTATCTCCVVSTACRNDTRSSMPVCLC